MKRVAALAAAQVLVMLGWAASNEWTRATAPTFRIPLRPVDPYDVLRGRYFILNPEDGRIETGAPPGQLTASEVERFLEADEDEGYYRGPALVGFCPVGALHRVCALRRPGEETGAERARFWSRARVVVSWRDTVWRDGRQQEDPGWVVDVDLGLDRFFLPNRVRLPAPENDPGWELEVSHRPGRTPLPLRLWLDGQPVRLD